MKKLTGWIVCVVLASQLANAESKIGIKAGGLYYIPKDKDVWDNGYGVEGQLQFWPLNMLGFSLSFGGAQWDLNGESVSYAAGGYSISGKGDGDATLIPLGGSILFRPVNTHRLALTLEGGVRYVVVDPSADYEMTLTTPNRVAVGSVSGTGGTRVYRYSVPGETFSETADYDAEDAVIGLAQADLEFHISETLSLFAGCGWQFDIVKSDASIKMFGEKIEDDVSLQAFFARAGAVIRF